MNEKFRGIVIDVTRYNEKTDIVTLFTLKRGRVSFVSPRGSGKSGKVRQSRLLPLAVLEGEMNFRDGRELQTLGQFSLSDVRSDIYFNPVKTMLAMFVSEFLNKLLRAAMPDAPLWHYIEESISLLDRMDRGLGNFHIVFLASLLPFAGIQPDGTQWEEGWYFDMQSGVFTESRPLHRDWLCGEEAAFASKLCRMDFSNSRVLRLDSEARNRILNGLLHYYGIHYPGADNLKSLSVIREVFHT